MHSAEDGVHNNQSCATSTVVAATGIAADLASSNAVLEKENEALVKQSEDLRRLKIEFTSSVAKLNATVSELEGQEKVRRLTNNNQEVLFIH